MVILKYYRKDKKMSEKNLSLQEVYEISYKTLVACGTSEHNASIMAESVRKAEEHGVRNIGLAYLPKYLGHLKHNKVIGDTVPEVKRPAKSIVLVDAKEGFAHPAFEAGFVELEKAVEETGIAAMGVSNSYSAGILGHLIEPFARKGYIAMCFANAPASVVPAGGKKPLYGTNPMAYAFPSDTRNPIIGDFATSATAKVNILDRAKAGKPLEKGWATDKNGNETTDGESFLDGGGILPFGGYKGSLIALLVEMLAVGLNDANWSHVASPFADNTGTTPRTGQFFIVIDPKNFGLGNFATRNEEFFQAILSQEGTQLPYDEKWEICERNNKEGVMVPQKLLDELQSYI